MRFTDLLAVAELPQLLQKGMRIAKTDSQSDMLLLSLLTASGYAMPNYYMRSGIPAHRYEPSLMTLVVAPPASGKGIMNMSRRLLQVLHERLRKQSEEALASATKEELPLVPQRMVFIPGNCSSNALLQILNDNDGCGCIFETEIDVVSQIWGRDYGNYSTLLRQAFEHETVSKARKTKTDAYLEVKHPRLSVLLSGTAGQLQPMLESRENGLASRFISYVAEEIVPFDRAAIINHDAEEADAADRIMTELCSSVTRMHDWLASQQQECEWCLSPEQADLFGRTWEDHYTNMLCELGMPLSFDPVIKRMAVSVQRIGMIISMLRYWETNVEPLLNEEKQAVLPSRLSCEEQDFELLQAIADVLTYHAITVHQMLPADEAVCYAEDKEEPKDSLRDSLPEMFTTREAIEAGMQLGQSERSVHRYLNELIEQKAICRYQPGKFKKI